MSKNNDKNENLPKPKNDIYEQFSENTKLLAFIWVISILVTLYTLWTGLKLNLTGFWLLEWWYGLWIIALIVVTPGIIKGKRWSIHVLFVSTILMYVIHTGVYRLHFPFIVALTMRGPYLFLPFFIALWFYAVRKRI